MFAKFIDVIQTFLTEPAILIGLLVGIGYALDKKSPIKIITGMVSAMVGLMMVLFGGFQFSATFKPVAEAVSKAYGVHGYLMDSYAMKAATQIALGDNFGYVGYVFVLAFFTNLLLVLFGRYTGAKGIFLTGNTGVSHSQAVLWLIVFWLGFSWTTSIIIAGILTGVSPPRSLLSPLPKLPKMPVLPLLITRCWDCGFSPNSPINLVTLKSTMLKT